MGLTGRLGTPPAAPPSRSEEGDWRGRGVNQPPPPAGSEAFAETFIGAFADSLCDSESAGLVVRASMVSFASSFSRSDSVRRPQVLRGNRATREPRNGQIAGIAGNGATDHVMLRLLTVCMPISPQSNAVDPTWSAAFHNPSQFA
jgi:hypothetical protein